MSKIISRLLMKNLITRETLLEMKKNCLVAKKPVQDLLIESGAIQEDAFLAAAREAGQFTVLDLSQIPVDPELLKLIPCDRAKYYGAFPVKKDHDSLVIAMSDPSDIVACDELRFLTDMNIKPVLSKKSQITECINTHYRLEHPVQEMLQNTLDDARVELTHEHALAKEEIADLANVSADDNSLVRLVNKLICDAVEGRASDIHIEPQEKIVEIRYRIDGYLKSVIKIPRELHARLTTRIKIMAKLDIAERRTAQDGRIKAILDDKKIDLRVSIIPLYYGEKIVLRILGDNNAPLELGQLGLEQDDLEIFKSALSKIRGVILVTGPTGSGKTTSLYAALRHIKNESINIVTIEDPIEYLIDGINQLQLSRHKDVTFANSLRTILRQDPDAILVGEIRDLETAEVAFQASLTGHLVFSTLHTNTAVSSLTRLMNIGLDPYMISSSLSLVVAQRLIRMICPECRSEYIPDEEILAKFKNYHEIAGIGQFYRGRGCAHCNYSGFYGRTSLFEILKIDESIQNLIFNKVSESVIFRKAVEKGMRTMAEAGIIKVAAGITTLDEVAKVADLREEPRMCKKPATVQSAFDYLLRV